MEEHAEEDEHKEDMQDEHTEEEGLKEDMQEEEAHADEVEHKEDVQEDGHTEDRHTEEARACDANGEDATEEVHTGEAYGDPRRPPSSQTIGDATSSPEPHCSPWTHARSKAARARPAQGVSTACVYVRWTCGWGGGQGERRWPTAEVWGAGGHAPTTTDHRLTLPAATRDHSARARVSHAPTMHPALRDRSDNGPGEPLACLLAAVFFPLDHTRIAPQQARCKCPATHVQACMRNPPLLGP